MEVHSPIGRSTVSTLATFPDGGKVWSPDTVRIVIAWGVKLMNYAISFLRAVSPPQGAVVVSDTQD